MDVISICKNAKKACYDLNRLDTNEKNRILNLIADKLVDSTGYILEENKKDIENARQNGLSESLIDRLLLTGQRISDMAFSARQVAELFDPVGIVLSETKRLNGMVIKKVTVPLGVIGMIYESRPNVTVDAAVLSLKSSNCCVLRGGKEAINTNIALEKVMRIALKESGIDENAINLIKDTSRQSATDLMKAKGYIDVIIPRGGAGLIKSTVENSTVPVIETGTGNCHIYVAKSADIDKAVEVLYNAKTTRVSVCNACESVLVDKSVADEFLKRAYKKLLEKGVIWYGCEETKKILPDINEANEQDYYTEYLDYKISCKIVDGVDEAISHINKYGTGHSDAIISEDKAECEKFKKEVDSACVYVNCSTRFTDGFEFGFGAEIGISTQKIHARGPMGLIELTSYKYIVEGDYLIR